MFCPSCAAENYDEAAHCFSCASPLPQDHSQTPPLSEPPKTIDSDAPAHDDEPRQPAADESGKSVAPQPPLSTGPVSGWLMVFCVSVGFLTPFGAASTLLQTPSPVGPLPGLIVAFRTFSYAMTLLLGVGGPIVAYRIFSKARGSITLAERFSWTAIGFYCLAFLFSGLVLNSYGPVDNPQYLSLVHRSQAQAAGRALYYGCWLAYFAKSSLVATLFGPPSSNR